MREKEGQKGRAREEKANELIDSTLGKVMEKTGHLVHNEKLVAKGAAKRQEAHREVEEKEDPPFAN